MFKTRASLQRMFLVLCVLAAGVLACGTPPAARVVQAQPLGTVAQSPLIIGRDGGGSALLWGLSVWLFGDTFSSVADAEGQTLHANSVASTSNLFAADGIALNERTNERTDDAGAPAYFLAPTGDEAVFFAAHQGDSCSEQPCGARYAAWPGTPLFDSAGNRALVPYMLVWAAPGDFNFYSVGRSFAVWDDFASLPERPVVSPGAAHPTLLFAEGEPSFGTAAVIEGDELYAYGCDQDGLSFECRLARVAVASVLDRSAWLFFDGTGWSTDISAARPILEAASIVNVQFNGYLGQWVALYSAPLSNDVKLRTAPAVTGPWSDELTLFTADREGLGGTSYDAAPHAEYSEDGGQVLYISYSRPNGNGPFGADFALERVTLGKP
jgi:hypothetical protein